MNSIRKTLVIACAAIGLMGTAYAGGEHGPGGHGFTPPTAEQIQAHFAEHFAKLHDKLGLQASQEAAWTTFVTAVTPTAPPVREDLSQLSAPERAQKMLDNAKEHLATATAHVAALNTFYATLSTDQKKIFDANFHPRHHGHHG